MPRSEKAKKGEAVVLAPESKEVQGDEEIKQTMLPIDLETVEVEKPKKKVAKKKTAAAKKKASKEVVEKESEPAEPASGVGRAKKVAKEQTAVKKKVVKKATKKVEKEVAEEIEEKPGPRVKTPVTEGLISADAKAPKEYYKVKKKLLEKEENNHSKIYFMWQRGTWFRAIGHSALIYHFDVAKRLHRESQLLADKDFGPKSAEGVVNVRDMEALDKILEKNGYKLIGENLFCRSYNAGKKYSDAELAFFMEFQEKELATVNSIVVPKDVFPHLLQLARQLGRMVYHQVAKMDKYARNVIGIEIVREMNELLAQYSLMTKYNQGVGAKSPEEFLDYAKGRMAWLQAKMGVLLEFRVMEARDVQKILITSGKIAREVEACQANLERK